MSDISTESPKTETAAAPAAQPSVSAPPSSEENAALRNALAKVQADYAGLQGQLSSLIVERDGLKGSVAKLEPLAKEADGLRVKVEGFINASRESAIIETLRSKLPGAEPLALKGVLAALAEQGKANRYAEDAAVESAKILKLIETEAPGLTRPPTSGGGTQSARPMTGGSAFRGPLSRG